MIQITVLQTGVTSEVKIPFIQNQSLMVYILEQYIGGGWEITFEQCTEKIDVVYLNDEHNNRLAIVWIK